MKTLIIFTTLLSVAGTTWTSHGQEDTAMQRKVYAEINAAADQMKLVEGELEVDGLTFELSGWKDDGGLRKIVARVPGEDGDGSEEYYWNDGELVFVFRHYEAAAEDGKTGAQMEDRFYLRDGKMFAWVNPEKQSIPPGTEDFALEEGRLIALGGLFAKALDEKPDGGAEAETTGEFLGIEEGDYVHWNMKDGKGDAVSYFILNPDASVEAVLKSPDAFVGKLCRATWKRSMEEIPEAGGEIEVEQILKVEWLKE